MAKSAIGESQRFAGRDADHLFDQVDPGDQLGDRMLDLKTGVHLQEIKRFILAGDELDGAGGIVVHRLGQGDGLGAHGLRGSPRPAAARAPPR